MLAARDCALADEMVTIRPHPAASMSGTAACRQWNVPVRLTARIRAHASGVISVNAANSSNPALVTMISTGPSSVRTLRSASSTADRSVTSTSQASARAAAGRRGGRLVGVAEAAERAGLSSIWFPQLPGDFDALTAIALMGRATDRVELGTAVLPIQTRHPVAMAQQALSNQAVCEGRFTLGLGPSHHWIVEDMLGLSYDKPARQVRDYLEVLNAAFAGPGPVDVDNDSYRVHNPLHVTDIATS